MHEILFPSPFGTPPSPELVARARLAPVPAGFTGRAGVLVFEDEAGVHAEHAFEPVSRALCGAGGEGRDWSTLRAAALWPGMSRDEVPERTLVDGRGVRFTVRDFLKAMFEPYPDLPEMQGGRELEARKAGWRMEPRRGARCGTKRSRRPGADLGEREDHRACRMVVRPDARARNTI